MAEIQKRSGGGGGSGGGAAGGFSDYRSADAGSGQQDQQQQREEAQAQDEMKRQALSTILDPDARDRCRCIDVMELATRTPTDTVALLITH
jgi:programmed cell death protein 5